MVKCDLLAKAGYNCLSNLITIVLRTTELYVQPGVGKPICIGFDYKLNIAGALSMLSIHNPDYVFMVLVSIFISKTHNHFLTGILVLLIVMFT